MPTQKNIVIYFFCVTIPLLFLILQLSVTGYCFLGICDDEIEIISATYPSPVKYDQDFLVIFTVKNAGENTAKNCILHFAPNARIIDEIRSPSFNIESGEKSFITLGFSGFGKDSDTVNVMESDLERTMTAWVVCDDLESHRATFGTIIDSSSIEGKLRESLSENP